MLPARSLTMGEGNYVPTEDHKALVHRFADGVKSCGNTDLIDGICSPGFVDGSASPEPAAKTTVRGESFNTLVRDVPGFSDRIRGAVRECLPGL